VGPAGDRPLASLIITAPGLVPARELHTLLSPVVETVITTTLLRAVSPAGIAEGWARLDYTLEQVAAASPDMVVQNTVAFALTGDPADVARLHAQISLATGAQVVVGLEAAVAALQSLGIRKPLVVAPYSRELRERFDVILRLEGIDPSAWAGPEISSPAAINAAADTDALEYVSSALERSTTTPDAVFISGGGWPSLYLVTALETRTGLPVVTSNTAQAWMVRRLAGSRSPFPAGGRLLTMT
jgi:maleate cis-trans isomerase